MVGRKASDVEFAEDAAEPLGSLQNPSDAADDEGSKMAHMEDLLLALAQPLVTSSADRCCNPRGVEASSGACEAESVASLAASLGSAINSSGPLGVLGLQPRGWLDNPATGA